MEMNHVEKIYFDDEDDSIKEYEILKKFKSHGILKERVELYRDFSLNLLYKIYDTYLGIEYIKTKKDAAGHYNWCFGKVLDEFDEQELDFYGNDELYDYFLEYYIDQFYSLRNQPKIHVHKKTWTEIFDYKKTNKKTNEFEVLVELYVIFDNSLEKKHRPVEVN
jgi:hypothetical protein